MVTYFYYLFISYKNTKSAKIFNINIYHEYEGVV